MKQPSYLTNLAELSKRVYWLSISLRSVTSAEGKVEDGEGSLYKNKIFKNSEAPVVNIINKAKVSVL